MKNLWLLVLLVTLTILSSCKKEEISPEPALTLHEKLIGTWAFLLTDSSFLDELRLTETTWQYEDNDPLHYSLVDSSIIITDNINYSATYDVLYIDGDSLCLSRFNGVNDVIYPYRKVN